MHVKRIIPLIVLVLIGVSAWWYFGSPRANAQTGELIASGTIEANQVIISPEFSGRVAQVLVEEGELVKAGQELVRLEDRLLQAQLEQARSAVAAARANYDLIAAGTPPEQKALAAAAAQLEVIQAQQALDELYNLAPLAAAQAQKAVADADKLLDQASDRVANLLTEADQADIDAAQAAVTLAKDKLDKANEKFEPYKKKPQDNVIRAMLQREVAEAQKNYDMLVTRLNNLKGSVNQLELTLAEANENLLREQLAEARRQFEKLQNGPDPDALQLAKQRLATAQARLAAAQAEPTAQQLALAQAQVQTAASALQVIEAQMEKLAIYAPLAGVVMDRLVNPGEITLPGATLLSLAELDHLTITVYVPEDRYGQIELGQQATVTSDSFPGQTFSAQVIDIADQAEFTPHNVQTPEGRRTTVFAVKLSIDDQSGRLKPGMPADVKFR